MQLKINVSLAHLPFQDVGLAKVMLLVFSACLATTSKESLVRPVDLPCQAAFSAQMRVPVCSATPTSTWTTMTASLVPRSTTVFDATPQSIASSASWATSWTLTPTCARAVKLVV